MNESASDERSSMSRNSYSPSFVECAPAHSGPELASSVPYPRLAQELARELLADHFELARTNVQAHSTYAGFADGVIGLARR